MMVAYRTLKVASANGRFQQGMNTIILPRAIALECQLNDTLYDLGSMTSSNVLYNASFYSTNMSSSTSSSHIVVVITKNVTATQAEAILTMLTFNSTNTRIGNNVTISSSALYLLHLPGDILSAIPTFVENAGMGSGPSYFTWGGLIKTIVNMTFNFLFWWAAGGVLLLWLHLTAIGLEAKGGLWAGVGAMIEDAVDTIVEGLDQLRRLALKMIDDLIDVYLMPIVDPAVKMLDEFVDGVKAGLNGLGNLYLALMGDMFYLLAGIGVVVSVILLAMQVVTNVFGFLTSILVMTLVGVIVTNLIGSVTGAYDSQAPQECTEGILSSFIDSTFSAAGKNQTVIDRLLAIFNSIWPVIGMIPAMVIFEGSRLLSDARGLAVSILGIVLAFYSIADQDGRMVVLSMALTTIGFIETIIHSGSITGKEIRAMTECISLTGMFLCAGDFICRIY